MKWYQNPSILIEFQIRCYGHTHVSKARSTACCSGCYEKQNGAAQESIYFRRGRGRAENSVHTGRRRRRTTTHRLGRHSTPRCPARATETAYGSHSPCDDSSGVQLRNRRFRRGGFIWSFYFLFVGRFYRTKCSTITSTARCFNSTTSAATSAAWWFWRSCDLDARSRW